MRARGRGKGGKGEQRERVSTDGAFFSTGGSSDYDASTDPAYDLLVESGIDLSTLDSSMTSGLDMDVYEEAYEEAKDPLAWQERLSDIQINPLPSIPSISSAGAASYTGTVSSIPGGFQPLPQVAGQRKKLYQLSKFHGGMNQKSSPRDISDEECQEAGNVTVSQVGRITLLGDCLNENNSIKEFPALSAQVRAAMPGYGLFEFTAPADWDGGNTGAYQILLTNDGDNIDALDHDGGHADWMDFAGSADTDGDVSPVFYASGNGVYAADAFFANDNTSKAKIWVYRKDYDSATPANAANLITSTWDSTVGGKPLINSPTFDAASGGGATVISQVAIDYDEGASVFTTATTAGAAVLHVSSDGTGLWTGDYLFYISWLFDGGVETGLTALQTQIAYGTTGGKRFLNQQLNFNFSVEDNNASRKHIGGDNRIDGARIYFKKVGDAERFLLAEVNLVDGIKGALDSTFIPWDEPTADTFDLAANIIFNAPPEVYTYASLNAYYANEVYNESPDILADATTGPVAKDVRYKTAVVGSGGIVFIGNVRFNGRHMPDSMMFSMPGKPGVFPQYNRFDSPSSDGSPIVALAAYRDTILQFKQNGMYVINVSNPSQFYAQASFRDCGVFNPCQVFTTSFGVIFVNKNGCYIYDGQRVTSLSDGKFDWSTQSYIGSSSPAREETADIDPSNFPCVGYDPRSQSIVVLKNIGDDSTDATAWVYNMGTQSWTEGAGMITNDNGTRHSNFIITSEGYLTIKSSGDATLRNYNHDMRTDNNATASAQVIEYLTKDMDFGLPSQTKKIFKVYVTYKGDADALDIFFGVDGGTIDKQLVGASNTPLQDVAVLTTVALTPTTSSQATGVKSFALRFYGSIGVDAADTFEINDISILYRVRPVK